MSRILLVLLVLLTPAALFAQIQTKVFVDEYIVQRAGPRLPNAALQSQAYAVVRQTKFTEVIIPKRSSAAMAISSAPTKVRAPYDVNLARADCEEILKDPSIKTCEPNFVQYLSDTFPNDPQFYDSQNFIFQWALYSPFVDYMTSWDTRAHRAWDITTGSSNAVVGIMDSGINRQHPDLMPNLWTNPGEIAGNGIDDDGNGYIDDVNGIDAFNRTGNVEDCNGHGSHVAGIIGAKGNNSIGMSGVAWTVRMITSKHAVDCGSGVSTEAAIRGMEYFLDLKENRGVNIVAVNASYGGSQFTQAESNMIQRLGAADIVFVAAAGNDGVNVDSSARYPAAYAHANILTVANLDNYNSPNALNMSSNYGAGLVHIAAPGTELYSTVQADPNFGPAQYDFKTGTSMAAPMVTGAIALLYTLRPYYNTDTLIKNTILGSARVIAPLMNKVSTGGMLDLYSMLTLPDPPDQCPGDANKHAPGHCGCNQTENYRNDDGDLVPNCADLCPSDANKVAPDVCGCGTEDSDYNSNGEFDCVDAGIQAAAPATPKLSVKNNKFLIKMEAREGVTYLVTITTKTVTIKKGKKKTKVVTKQQISAGATASIKKPKAGAKVEVAYQFLIAGGPLFFTSQSSPIKKKKIL